MEDTIKLRFPNQFKGPYYLGTGIGEGWQELVTSACQRINDALTPPELAIFHWIQIKQKFGGLKMYWGPHNTLPVTVIGPDEIAHLQVETKAAPAFSPETVAKIRVIVQRASRQASRTCEVCGSHGRMYPEGYWQTLCDTHAAEAKKTFPATYGELIECRPRKQQFGSEEAISTREIYFKDAGGRVWDWSDPARKSFILADDLPDGLVDVYLTAKNGKFDVPYADEDYDGITTFAIDDFLKTVRPPAARGARPITDAYFKMPRNARRDTRTQLERDIQARYDTPIKIASRIDAKTRGGFAAGTLEDGSVKVFSIGDPYQPEHLESPEEAIQGEMEKLDRMRAQLEAMLALLEKHDA